MTDKKKEIVTALLNCGAEGLSILLNADKELVLNTIYSLHDMDLPITLKNIFMEMAGTKVREFARGFYLAREDMIISLEDDVAELNADLSAVRDELKTVAAQEPLFVDESDDYSAKTDLEAQEKSLLESIAAREEDISELKKMCPERDIEWNFDYSGSSIFAVCHERAYLEYFADDLENLRAQVGIAA